MDVSETCNKTGSGEAVLRLNYTLGRQYIFRYALISARVTTLTSDFTRSKKSSSTRDREKTAGVRWNIR